MPRVGSGRIEPGTKQATYHTAPTTPSRLPHSHSYASLLSDSTVFSLFIALCVSLNYSVCVFIFSITLLSIFSIISCLEILFAIYTSLFLSYKRIYISAN